MNHAVYVSYYEQARWLMLEEQGITLDSFEQWQCWPIVNQLEVSYRRPAHMGDELEIRTSPLEFTGARMIFDQKIFRDGELISQAKITLANIDKSGRPLRVHPEFRRMADKYLGNAAQ